jgi:hypothetical protein
MSPKIALANPGFKRRACSSVWQADTSIVVRLCCLIKRCVPALHTHIGDSYRLTS